MASQIPGIGIPSGPPAPGTPAQGKGQLGKDDFLKLLMAQLGAQDPLKPVDNSEFVAQLAQFTALEQSTQTNQRLEELVMAQASSNQTATANLVGKEIVYRTDRLHFDGHSATTITGRLAADAASVSAIITDASGKEIRHLTVREQKSGPVGISWNGLDDNGRPVPAGDYGVRLTAADAGGASIDVGSRTTAVASGISFEAGFAEILVRGTRVRMGDVVEINQPPAPGPAATPTTPQAI